MSFGKAIYWKTMWVENAPTYHPYSQFYSWSRWQSEEFSDNVVALGSESGTNADTDTWTNQICRRDRAEVRENWTCQTWWLGKSLCLFLPHSYRTQLKQVSLGHQGEKWGGGISWNSTICISVLWNKVLCFCLFVTSGSGQHLLLALSSWIAAGRWSLREYHSGGQIGCWKQNQGWPQARQAPAPLYLLFLFALKGNQDLWFGKWVNNQRKSVTFRCWFRYKWLWKLGNCDNVSDIKAEKAAISEFHCKERLCNYSQALGWPCSPSRVS